MDGAQIILELLNIQQKPRFIYVFYDYLPTIMQVS